MVELLAEPRIVVLFFCYIRRPEAEEFSKITVLQCLICFSFLFLILFLLDQTTVSIGTWLHSGTSSPALRLHCEMNMLLASFFWFSGRENTFGSWEPLESICKRVYMCRASLRIAIPLTRRLESIGYRGSSDDLRTGTSTYSLNLMPMQGLSVRVVSG